MTEMPKYMILLGTHPWQAVLIEDSNPKAQRPFDGGTIHYAPATYPAIVCSFRFGRPIYAQNAAQYDPPLHYPSEMLDYQEKVVSTEDDWKALRMLYINGGWGS